MNSRAVEKSLLEYRLATNSPILVYSAISIVAGWQSTTNLWLAGIVILILPVCSRFPPWYKAQNGLMTGPKIVILG